MGKCFYTDITLDLDSRIRRGEFQEKLSTARCLAREYGVSLQTINTAVKPYIRSGLLSSERRNGLCIHRKNLRTGMIGVVGWFSPGNSFEIVNYQRLLDEITKDGFSYMLLSAPPRDIPSRQAGLFSKFDAIMFTNGSFNMTVAEHLDREGIPFIGDGMQPTYPNLSFLELDSLATLETLTVKLTKAGYQKIGLCYPSPRDGFNELIQRRWRKIKKQLNIPLIYGDHIRYDWHVSMNDNVIFYLKQIRKSGKWPEVIIFWNSLSDWLFKRVREEIGAFPENMLPVTGCGTGHHLPESFLLFEHPSFSDFYLDAWKILKKRIYLPELPPIQEWQEYRLRLKNKLKNKTKRSAE